MNILLWSIIIILIIIIIVTIILLYNKNEYLKSNIEFNPSQIKFQHNNYIIDKNNLNYVRNYKKILLKNTAKLLDDLNIKYVISHGNLIEYERGKPIYHDDDIDIRYDINDIYKWIIFCKNNNRIVRKYNLKFDHKFKDIRRQIPRGIHISLHKYNDIKVIGKFNIHVDLVPNIAEDKFWLDYDIDYNNLRNITFLDVKTYSPSKEDTHKVLSKQYGENYLIPKPNYNINF